MPVPSRRFQASSPSHLSPHAGGGAGEAPPATNQPRPHGCERTPSTYRCLTPHRTGRSPSLSARARHHCCSDGARGDGGTRGTHKMSLHERWPGAASPHTRHVPVAAVVVTSRRSDLTAGRTWKGRYEARLTVRQARAAHPSGGVSSGVNSRAEGRLGRRPPTPPMSGFEAAVGVHTA